MGLFHRVVESQEHAGGDGVLHRAEPEPDLAEKKKP
jgi:hypothetical protein